MIQNPLSLIEEQLRKIITDAVNSAMENGKLPKGDIPEFAVEIPKTAEHGDLSANIAMVGARAFRMAPPKIAAAITEEISLENSYFSKCEIAGPGFMNFFLGKEFAAMTVKAVLDNKENYGRTDYGKNKRVLVEFVSANPTGPMHIGNARGGALGDCLAASLDWAGYDVNREFYVNDAGNQIEKFKTSLEVRYLQIFDPSIEMPEDAYLGQDIIDHAKNFEAIHGDKYVNADREERRQALCDFALPKNIAKLKTDLEKYRINYDKWFHESSLHNDGSVKEIIEKMKASGYTYEKDGALWFKATELGDEKDRVLVRDNGIPTYFVPDIAYHYNKLVTRGYDKAIDILGADHHGYIARMKAALTALGIDSDRLDIIIMQMVRLIKDGETYKLSKRSGKAITLETLLEEVPIDAARLFFNLREPNSHLEFDLDLAISENSQNPVYYVQYAHARICSILKVMEDTDIADADLTVLTEPSEKALIFKLAGMPSQIISAAKEYDPSVITRYLIDLATLFHRFYTECRVKDAPDDIRKARVALLYATKQAICNGCVILGITAPEYM